MNFDIGRLFTSNTGRILVSIIWGLGLAALFKKACEGRNCQVIQYQGPNHEGQGVEGSTTRGASGGQSAWRCQCAWYSFLPS